MTKVRILPQRHEELSKERTRRGWTQQQVADAVGTDRTTVGRWERGLTLPGPYYRQRLADLFGRSPEALGLCSLEDQEARIDLDVSPELAMPKGSLVPSSPLLDPAVPPKRIEVIGRSSLLDRLRVQLIEGRPSLLALYGLPGMGKTTLAMALAHDQKIRAAFSAILWAGLGPHPNLSPLLTRWSELLGVEERPEDMGLPEQILAIRKAIGKKRVLIILDDVWDLQSTQVLQIGGTTYLTTTRFREIAVQIASEPGAALHVPELAEQDAIALLRHLAPSIVEARGEEARTLVNATGGLPLALTLVGHYLMQAHDHQSRRIQRALAALQLGETRLALTQSPHLLGTASRSWENLPSISLSMLLDLSVQSMDENVQHMLTALVLFPPKPNSFSEEAAVAASGGTVDFLDRLIDAALVEVSGPDRYTIHQVVADYARCRWQMLPPKQRRQMLERLLAHFAKRAKTQNVEHDLGNLLALIQEMDHEGLISEEIVAEIMSSLEQCPLCAWGHEDTQASRQQQLLSFLDPPHLRSTFVRIITKVIPDFEVPLIEKRSHVLEAPPLEFLLRVLAANSTTAQRLRVWTVVELILQQLLAVIDPKRMGIAVIVAQCTPPASPDDHIRSVREITKKQSHNGMFQTALKLFHGAESLAGYCVELAQPSIIQNMGEERRFRMRKQEELSAAAYPIVRGAGHIAGCLLLSSPLPHVFTPRLQYSLQVYAHLLSLAFETEQFYPSARIKLRPMPPEDIQQGYLEHFQEKVSLLLQCEPDVSHGEAETKAWQQMEEALLSQVFLPASSSE